MGILEKIQDIENEIKRTQKNKGKISRMWTWGTFPVLWPLIIAGSQPPSTILVCSKQNLPSTVFSY